jgi:hypothetical protein
MNRFVLVLSLVAATLMSNSCNESGNPGSSNLILPNVSGSAGEVLVVMDPVTWKSRPGTIMRETLEQEYPALTQPEPLFDVIQITPGAFDNMFRQHRTILIVNIAREQEKPEIGYFENVWAKPQLIVRINATDSYELESLLEKEKDRLKNNLQSYDRKRLAELFNDTRDPAIRTAAAKYNLSLAIPRGYNIDLSNDEFASFSIETPKTSQVILVYQVPLNGKDDLDTDRIIFNRNNMLRKYTQGSRPGSYMTTASLFKPMTFDIRSNGKELVELRGLWELYNGFMGGPFVSHTIIDSSRNMAVTVEGYAYNPNEKKRNMMRQLEAIIYSAELINK